MRLALSKSPRFPSPSIMIKWLVTPLSLQNWFTYSTTLMPYCCLATTGKSRLVILFAKRVRCRLHSASEISKKELAGKPAATFLEEVQERTAAPTKVVPASCTINRRRVVKGITIVFKRQRYLILLHRASFV